MTPPPAATHTGHRRNVAQGGLGEERRHAELALALFGHRNWARMRLVGDVVVLYLASSAALLANPLSSDGVGRWLTAVFPLVTIAVLHARRTPDQRLQASVFDTGAYVLGAVSLSAMLTIAGGSVLGDSHPVGLAVRLWVFALVYLGGARIVLLSVRREALRDRSLATPTLVVGAGAIGEQLVTRLMEDHRYGLRPVGFLDDAPPRAEGRATLSVRVLGGFDDLADAAARTGARQVILAFSSEPDHLLVEKVKQCQQLGLEVSLVPRLYEWINARANLDHIGGMPLVSLRPTDPHGWEFAIKHALDRSLAVLALIALAPLMAAIAIGVRVSSPGPILFRQRRVGRDGREFDLLKFRTMRESTSTHEFQLPPGSAPGGVEGEDRRTRLGQLLRVASLDELPQLINVLRGEMSIVGPRPERPEFVHRFSSELDRYPNRHQVKSGITGWAQVNGLRGQTSIAERVELDNFYIQNFSLRLDLRIIAFTVTEVLRFRG